MSVLRFFVTRSWIGWEQAEHDERASAVIYVFEDFEADADLFELRHRGAPVAIQRKALDLLLYLVRHRDRVVSRTELIEHVWGGITITENAIAQAVSALRTTLARIPGHTIATVRGRGFRFALPIHQSIRELPRSRSKPWRIDGDEPTMLLLAEPTSRREIDAAAGAFAHAPRLVIHAGHSPLRPFGTVLDIAQACNSALGATEITRSVESALAAIRETTTKPVVLLVLHVEQADLASLLLLTRGTLLMAGGPVAIIMTCEASALTRDDDVGALLRGVGTTESSPRTQSGFINLRAKEVG